MSFLGEIKRRKVFQVAAVYAVVAWLLIQIVATVESPLNLPDWFDSAIIVFLAVGFPVAVILSWAFDLTAEGLVRTPRSNEGHVGASRRVETVLVLLLLVAIGWIGYREIGSPDTISSGTLPNSVAVLPFANLSPDPAYAYFAAGLHDEILNQLARIRDLNVIARTSVMRYSDSDMTLSEIAGELKVGALMEGTVRYAGERVRITAQLIDPASGTHLWSTTYDRELNDMFAVESDIAMNIADALEAELSPAERERIERIPTESAAAYQLYIKARSRSASWSADLDQAIRLDPEFSAAYALKALLTAATIENTEADPARLETLEPVVRETANRALELDPESAVAYTALAIVNSAVGNLADADETYQRALELSPNDSDVLFFASRFKRYVGQYDAALRLSQRGFDLDPNGPGNFVQLGFSHWYAQNFESAATIFAYGSELAPQDPVPHAWRGFVEVSRGNFEDALNELELAEQLWIEGASALRAAQVALAYGQMGRNDDALRFFNELRGIAEGQSIAEAVWAIGYLGVGDHEAAYGRLAAAVERPVAAEQIALSELKANPYKVALLEEDRWRELRDQIGVL